MHDFRNEKLYAKMNGQYSISSEEYDEEEEEDVPEIEGHRDADPSKSKVIQKYINDAFSLNDNEYVADQMNK